MAPIPGVLLGSRAVVSLVQPEGVTLQRLRVPSLQPG